MKGRFYEIPNMMEYPICQIETEFDETLFVLVLTRIQSVVKISHIPAEIFGKGNKN